MADSPSLLGQTISHYHVLEVLGGGGMGVVYRARDLHLERTVALKVLSQDFGSPENREKIFAEARAAAALNHPGVTTIYEVGEHPGGLFIAMELVEGSTLRELLGQGPFEARRLVRIATLIAEALEAAHAQGVVHGDVKPENIVLQTNERIKLLDFGVARRLTKLALTTSITTDTVDWIPGSHVAGTLSYMAPEQLRGETIDPRADLFSLGAVLYELATATRPFQAKNAPELIAQILSEDAAPALSGNHNVPPELERVIGRLLEKKRSARYQSARELQIELNNLLRDLEVGDWIPATVAGKRSVAILPFRLLTPSSEDEYLGVALADALIHELAASGELLVRPTSMVERYAKVAVDPLRAARELKVQIVTHGGIQRSAGRLRIHLQAWDASTSSVIHSAKHDGEIQALFALQDQLASDLRGALGIQHRSTQEGTPEPPTANPHAYELFLRAADRLARLNRWDTRTAIEMLEQAVMIDPKFADAWARLAEACLLIGTALEPHPRWVKRAGEAIRKALSLDRHSAEAHCARGRLLWTPAQGFKNRPALRALRESLRINPGCHPARVWQCLILLHLGLHAEARRGLVEALASHPDDAFILVFIGQTAMYRCDYAEAKEYTARALSIDSAHIWGNGFSPSIALYEGKLDEAEEKIRLARQVLADDPWLQSCEALLWALRGNVAKADALAKKSLRPVKAFLHTHHLWHTAAAAYAITGRHTTSVALLKRAAAQGLPNYPAFRDDPFLKPLHARADFRNLLTKLKGEWEGYGREFGQSSQN